MKLSDRQKQKMFEHGIPEYMHGGIIRFYENGIPPGGFLTSVIDNNLKDACAHADDTNKLCLFRYMMWFYNEAPGGTWGFSGAVDKWCNKIADELQKAS